MNDIYVIVGFEVSFALSLKLIFSRRDYYAKLFRTILSIRFHLQNFTFKSSGLRRNLLLIALTWYSI